MIKHTKRTDDLFRPMKKGDRLKQTYLFADGHAIACFERYIRDTGATIHYVKQISSLGVSCRFKGRIVFCTYGGTSWLRAALAAGCESISATVPSLEHGSPNTKTKGIAVGYVQAETEFGDITDYDFPGLISGNHTYQPDVDEAFRDDLEKYSSENVVATYIFDTK